MTTFPKPDRWSIYLRRSVLALSLKDANLFDKLLTPYEQQFVDNLGGYQIRARMGVVGAEEASP